MTDPRRLIARLNPSTIRYDIGRGGTPELTAHDIAAALDGDKLDALVRDAVHAEMCRRRLAEQHALLSLHLAQEDAAARRVVPAVVQSAIKRFEAQAAQAKAQAWANFVLAKGGDAAFTTGKY